ncbi:polymerase, partial [Enterococcus faecalis]
MRIGFFENRLYGVFVEPNYACTISLVCILVGVRNFINTNSKWLKVVCAMVIFLQFSYVALSGSRSGVIQLISMVIFGMFFTIWFFQKNTSKAVIKKVVQAVLV